MQKRKSAVSPWIYSALRLQFGQLTAERMAQALIEANFPQPPTVLCDRIHIAIIKEADGDLVRFLEMLRLAQKDWRQVVVSADLGDSKWRQQLTQAGIQPPTFI